MRFMANGNDHEKIRHKTKFFCSRDLVHRALHKPYTYVNHLSRRSVTFRKPLVVRWKLFEPQGHHARITQCALFPGSMVRGRWQWRRLWKIMLLILRSSEPRGRWPSSYTLIPSSMLGFSASALGKIGDGGLSVIFLGDANKRLQKSKWSPTVVF